MGYIDHMATPYKLNQWTIFAEQTVTSTQLLMREKLALLQDRTVIIASSQTSGRGRTGRAWISPVGGFYSSFLLKPSPPINLAPCVSLLTAVVLTRLLKRRGIEASVKWPNDVVVEGKKIAGIIAEAGTFPESWFILGIGVNLTSFPDIPDRKFLPPGAWSEFSDAPQAEELLGELLFELDSSWSRREDNPLDSTIDELNSILWKKGKTVTLLGGREEYHGTLLRVDADGSLVLLTELGETRFVSGELNTVPEERG